MRISMGTKEIGIKIEQNITIKNPDLWDIETPNLYKARLILKQKGKIIDEYKQTFGIRSIHFEAETGFTFKW